jgi:hypothetical protein
VSEQASECVLVLVRKLVINGRVSELVNKKL